MIHLITINPAVDNYIGIDNIEINKTNYSTSQNLVFGGKAINVAKLINEFSKDYNLVTTTSKVFDSFINDELANINHTLIDSEQVRINTKLKSNGDITEVNSLGVSLSDDSKNQFTNYVQTQVKENDHVLIAGNPNPDDFNFMIKLCKQIKAITKFLYLDSSKLSVDNLKDIKPYFIKPNIDELCDLLNKDITKDTLEDNLKDLFNYVSNIMVSLGSEGIYYSNGIDSHFTTPIRGKVINTVGAGDSAVGGTILSILNNSTIKDTANFAALCGSSTAFSESIATKEYINNLKNEL